MTTQQAATLASHQAVPAATFRKENIARRVGDVLLYLLIGGLVAGAWWFTQLGLFEAGDDVGYWLGVTGGVFMLLLFSYPLRKHFKVFHRWGKVKWWFLVHMVLGIGGPLLILLHSTFRVGSVNAAVALYSMLIVAGSGVVGRFLYVRVSKGLHGEVMTLRQLQARAGLDASDKHSKLAFAPAVEKRLVAFEQRELAGDRGVIDYTRQALLLSWQSWWLYRQCSHQVRLELKRLAPGKQWTPADLNHRSRSACRLVQRYIHGVVRVAKFGAYERLFALWHVAHVPFVYLLILSAVVHVFAVHAY